MAALIIFCGMTITVGWLFQSHSQPPSFFPASGIEVRKSNTHIPVFASSFENEPTLGKKLCAEVGWSLLGGGRPYVLPVGQTRLALSFHSFYLFLFSPWALCPELPWKCQGGEAKIARDTTNLLPSELSLLLFPASRWPSLDYLLCQRHISYIFRLTVVELSVICSLEHS